jgi:hypothetical protein
LFGLLVVGATGCSSLVSGMFFVYDRHWWLFQKTLYFALTHDHIVFFMI